jgi:hypothetical protein
MSSLDMTDGDWKVAATIEIGGAGDISQEASFVYDNTKPVLTQIQVRDSEKEILKAEAKDGEPITYPVQDLYASYSKNVSTSKMKDAYPETFKYIIKGINVKEQKLIIDNGQEKFCIRKEKFHLPCRWHGYRHPRFHPDAWRLVL